MLRKALSTLTLFLGVAMVAGSTYADDLVTLNVNVFGNVVDGTLITVHAYNPIHMDIYNGSSSCVIQNGICGFRANYPADSPTDLTAIASTGAMGVGSTSQALMTGSSVVNIQLPVAMMGNLGAGAAMPAGGNRLPGGKLLFPLR